MLQNGRIRRKGARKLERCSKNTKANHILKNVRSKSVAFCIVRNMIAQYFQ